MATLTMYSSKPLESLLSTLYSTLDESHFFGQLSGFFKEENNVERVLIYKLLESGNSQLMAKDGLAVFDGEILDKGIGAQGYLARTKKGYFSNSVERDPVFTREASLGVKAELCLPIMSEGNMIGSIHLQMLSSQGNFTREDVALGMNMLLEIKGPIQNMSMYLTAKNLNENLQKAIEQKEKELQESRTGVRIQDSYKISAKDIIGRSPFMRDLLGLVDRISDKEINAYILGEAGTGKEMMARRIHCRSLRRERAFVVIDCSIMNEVQMDRELFGVDDRPGLIEIAHFGTLFLNAVEKMPLSIQNKFNQFLSTKMGMRSVGQQIFKSDIRVCSASTRDLMELVREGKFREDLYFALSPVLLKIPALRERKEDIELLANHYLNDGRPKDQHKSFSMGAIQLMLEHSWPGNVRELQNAVERASILAEGMVIDKLHFDHAVLVKTELAKTEKEVEGQVNARPQEFQFMTLSELERQHIMVTLENLSGNKTKTAKVLGITVKTLYNKLHSYGIEFDKEA